MVDAGKSMGKRMVALITDMDQPLGRAAGHANEIIECIEVLNGKGPADVRELSVELSAWMFYLGEKTKSVEEGRKLATQMISSGEARRKFKQCIRLQGGDERVIDKPDLLPTAVSKVDVSSNSGGVLVATDCQQFGIALAMLGGGRETKEDQIDHAVGVEFHKRIGDRIEIGEPLATIHYNSDGKLAEAKDLVAESFVIDQDSSGQGPRALIRRIIGA
jgi:thymidine phosphorylase